MSKTISGSLLIGMTSTIARPVYLVQIEVSSSNLFLSSSVRDISYNGQLWLGNGMLKNPIEGLSETEGVEASAAQIKLNNLDAALMALLLGSLNRSKKAYVTFGALDSNYNLIADPVLIFTGNFSTVEFTETGEDTEAKLVYENNFIYLNKTQNFRYTHESQQLLYSGDKGFEYVSKLPDWSGFWGKAVKAKSTRKRKTATGRV